MEFEDYPHDPPAGQPRDPAIDLAIPKVLEAFSAEPSPVLYSTQLETRFEREFYHWITNKALKELGDGRKLQREGLVIQGNPVNFYAHPGLRYWARERTNIQGRLERLFDPVFTQAVGDVGEMLFDAALARNGFVIMDSNARSWAGRTWTESGHNLDRIAVRDGIAYGIEVKNKQNYISRVELWKKLDMCDHLGLVPLFIMRFAPKNYINDVYRRRGFTLLFEDQFYPPMAQTQLADARALGLKAQIARVVPQGHMDRLLGWHAGRLRRLQAGGRL